MSPDKLDAGEPERDFLVYTRVLIQSDRTAGDESRTREGRKLESQADSRSGGLDCRGFDRRWDARIPCLLQYTHRTGGLAWDACNLDTQIVLIRVT